MAECNTTSNMIGRVLTVGFAIGCGDDVFTGLTYLPLGTINDKQLDFAANTDDNTSDLSGGVSSELVVNTAFTLAVSGFLTKKDSALSAQNKLIQFYFDKVLAGEQPTVWIKIEGPGYPFIWHNFMNYKGGNEGHGTAATSTRSFDFGISETGSAQKSINIAPAP